MRSCTRRNCPGYYATVFDSGIDELAFEDPKGKVFAITLGDGVQRFLKTDGSVKFLDLGELKMQCEADSDSLAYTCSIRVKIGDDATYVIVDHPRGDSTWRAMYTDSCDIGLLCRAVMSMNK